MRSKPERPKPVRTVTKTTVKKKEVEKPKGLFGWIKKMKKRKEMMDLKLKLKARSFLRGEK
jgi:hypothetical protein